jgi:nitrogen fixation NifU-like protein
VTSSDNPAGDLRYLYRDAIRQHSSNPVGYRRDIDATHRHEEYNPQCGDRIDVLLRVAGERVEAAAFDGEACAICMASASLLCSLAPGRSVSELEAMGAGVQEALNEPVGSPVGAALAAIGSDEGRAKESRLKPLLQESLQPLLHPDLHPLLGVRPYPSRVRCATLPWSAARRALAG